MGCQAEGPVAILPRQPSNSQPLRLLQRVLLAAPYSLRTPQLLRLRLGQGLPTLGKRSM